MDACDLDLAHSERPYMGLCSAQRIAERRRRLVDAGIRIISARGCAEMGVRNVCVEADLSHRYFYESFKCRDELVFAAYEKLQQTLISSVIAAMGNLSEHCAKRLNRSVEAFLHFFEHNAHARWILFESNNPQRSDGGERLALLSEYEAMLADELMLPAVSLDTNRCAAKALASGLLGATIHLTVRWLFHTSYEPVDETLRTLQFLYSGAVQSLPQQKQAPP